MPDHPEPPTGVRIAHADGTTTGPVELRYVGVEDGLHVWVPVNDLAAVRRGDEVHVDVMPPRTTLSFPTLWPVEPD